MIPVQRELTPVNSSDMPVTSMLLNDAPKVQKFIIITLLISIGLGSSILNKPPKLIIR